MNIALQTVKPNLRTLLAPTLSVRQIQVLQLAANGYSIKATADALYITEDTVATHNRHIAELLQATNMKHAVAIGFRLKLIK